MNESVPKSPPSTPCRIPWHRRVGVVAIALAALLALLGLTVLKTKLHGLGFLLYWIACYVSVGLAILMALFDAWLVGRWARQERTELIRRSFGNLPNAGDDEGRSGTGSR